MKLKTIKYLIKEGFVNTWKNKMMCLASMGIVVASLIILGMFLLIGANITHIGEIIESSLKIEVFLEPNTSDDKAREIEAQINSFNLGEAKLITKEEAVNRLKSRDMFKGREELLEGYVLPPSVVLSLKKAEYGDRAVEQIKGIPGIVPDDIKYNKDVIEKVVRYMNIIRIISLVVLALLSVTAVFIIANTIKLTVFARRKEIGIMKYIGATDGFISWPFIIESIIIGTIASLVALFIVSYGYNVLMNYVMSTNTSEELGMTSFVNFNTISNKLLLIYLAIGIGLGCFGSAISIRKYLRV